ncbi:MAG: agglutinin biogenesis protein MshI [Gallionellales bacterium GWA2_55_18]|nr:MAG: agglutinin biogenesis protein MshI [Gallionellales bacterium GWA2_55_18]
MNIQFISSLFKSRRRGSGWLAVVFGKNGVHLSKIESKGAMPHVVRCEYHDMRPVSAVSLGKLRRAEKIGACDFITLLAPSEYQMLMVETPNVPANELKTAVRWKIKDSLSYHVEDATIDVLPIPAGKSGSEKARSVYVIAASNITIKKHIALFEQAKINLGMIDIPEMAQRNIASLFEQGDQALAMLAFDENGGLLTFTAGGELYLSRFMEINVGQLLDASESLRKQYRDRVEFELQRSLDYFDSQFSYLTVDRVLVCVPDNTGLVEFLAGKIDTKVERLDLSQVMDISAVPMLADSEFVARALPSLGAALRPERRAR